MLKLSPVFKSIYLIVFAAFFVVCKTKNNDQEIPDSYNTEFSYNILAGLEPDQHITRRDPSDIILYDNEYYVWYTRTAHGHSGYNASIWYATSSDGHQWRERGEALARGDKGKWDEFSVFTPNILVESNKFYLFYTGVKPTPESSSNVFENNHTTDITAIGLAVAELPDGPFQRLTSAVLEVSDDTTSFDSYRVDDACLLKRNNKYWLYYKGRSRAFGSEGPRHTKMGVALADKPEGPYVKHEANPITNGGHEVMVWSYKEGVMTLLSAHGEDGKTLQVARDGIHFRKVGIIGDDYPRAPGYFKAEDLAEAVTFQQPNFWGISMNYGDSVTRPYLIRYNMSMKIGEPK